MKYDKMIAITQEESKRKMQLARNAISEMLESMERITVAELVRKTGLSRGFFYKNPAIRAEMDEAIRRQITAFNNQKQRIMPRETEDIMLDLRIELLRVKEQNEKLLVKNKRLETENQELRIELEKLDKRMARKELSLLKGL